MSARSLFICSTACLVLLVLSCMAAGCASSPSAPVPATLPAPDGGGSVITIKNFAFDPGSLTVKSGTTVTWTNQDSAPHTIVSDTGSPLEFSSPSLPAGSTYTFSFTRAGTYTYHCSIHPSMKGTVVVQ